MVQAYAIKILCNVETNQDENMGCDDYKEWLCQGWHNSYVGNNLYLSNFPVDVESAWFCWNINSRLAGYGNQKVKCDHNQQVVTMEEYFNSERGAYKK